MAKYPVSIVLRADDAWFSIFHHPDGELVGSGDSYEQADAEMLAAVHAKYPDLYPTFVTDIRVHVGDERIPLDRVRTRRRR